VPLLVSNIQVGSGTEANIARVAACLKQDTMVHDAWLGLYRITSTGVDDEKYVPMHGSLAVINVINPASLSQFVINDLMEKN
jgi:hypothetical protein